MDIASTFNARHVCYLSGKPFWVRAMGLEGWAEVAAWLDDFLPGRSERDRPPAIADPASQAMLETDPGRALLAWIALRDDADCTYEAAFEIFANAEPGEQEYLLAVLKGRRRTRDDAPGVGTDIGETWCGEGMAELARAIGVEALGRLSIDQLEWLIAGGAIDRHRDPDTLAYQEACRQWEESDRRRKEQEAQEAADRPEEVV
jgi:hypothetical protein